MMPISSVSTGAVRPLAEAEKVLGTPNVQKPEDGNQSPPSKPATDEYIPAEKQEPSGRYWMGKDEAGRPKIYFDDPERAAHAPSKSEEPEEGREKEERCICDTGKVDREIEKLKKKQQELEQRLRTETDEVKGKNVERQLEQVKRELAQKDQDTYRKQNSTFTQL